MGQGTLAGTGRTGGTAPGGLRLAACVAALVMGTAWPPAVSAQASGAAGAEPGSGPAGWFRDLRLAGGGGLECDASGRPAAWSAFVEVGWGLDLAAPAVVCRLRAGCRGQGQTVGWRLAGLIALAGMPAWFVACSGAGAEQPLAWELGCEASLGEVRSGDWSLAWSALAAWRGQLGAGGVTAVAWADGLRLGLVASLAWRLAAAEP